MNIKKNLYHRLYDEEKKEFIEIRFFLQPIICPKTMYIFAYEVLTRFKSKDINVEGYFKNITLKISKEIIKLQLIEINSIQVTPSVIFTINMNADVLSDDNFVLEYLSKSNKNVAIEITSMPDSNTQSVKLLDNIISIRNSGCQVWLDDYLSSDITKDFLYFCDWDVVKIDRKFILNHIKSPDVLLDVVIKSSSLGRRNIIFEGVESQLIHDKLLRFNGLHQGFFYCNSIDSSALKILSC